MPKPRREEGMLGWDAGGFESMIEDSSSFLKTQTYMSDGQGGGGSWGEHHTLPWMLKTAPLPELKRGQSGATTPSG